MFHHPIDDRREWVKQSLAAGGLAVGCFGAGVALFVWAPVWLACILAVPIGCAAFLAILVACSCMP